MAADEPNARKGEIEVRGKDLMRAGIGNIARGGLSDGNLEPPLGEHFHALRSRVSDYSHTHM